MLKSTYRLTSFKSKLIGLMVGVTFISLLLASSGLSIIQFENFRKSLEESSLSNAAILAFNLAPTLVFDDAASANLLLSSFETLPHIEEAKVYRVSNQQEPILVASYPEGIRDTNPQEIKNYLTSHFEGQTYRLTFPIEVDDELVGYLYIRSEFTQLSQFQLQMLVVGMAIMFICLLLALLISIKFQTILLRPLGKLLELTQNVSRNKDYSLRVESMSNDEFSHLALSFNEMLQEIQRHAHNQEKTENKIRQLNLHLEDKVKERTLALELSNKHLMSTLKELNESQGQLVEKEKMASLGGLVAGIAHEINTPIGIGVTAISHMAESLRQLEARFESENLRQKDLSEFLVVANEGASITLNNLSRAADLVRSFKQVAVDQSSENIRSLNVKAYLHEILMSLRPQLKKVLHDIDLHLEEDLEVTCNAGALSQVLTNLIMNSLIHGFEGIQKGAIKIKIKKEAQQVYLSYEDNGIGMPVDSLKHLFEPFFTTRRGKGGSGLGAHLIYNLVTQGLNGRISVFNKASGGLQFDVEFPEAQ